MPWTGIAYRDGAIYIAEGGERDGGRIVRFDLPDGKQTVLVDNLPSLGDHHTSGPVVASDGWVYFGQGTATNAGIAGPELARHPDLHDIPCRDVTLAGTNFEAGGTSTGAYLPFGTPSEKGQVIKGQLPCSGAIMRVKTTGGPVELVAWGFRNPAGLALDNGALYATDNGYDTRGSRPVFGSADVLWKVEMSHWYGWPDFSEGRPLTAAFYSEGDGKPGGFLLADHPERPREPRAYLPVHASADGLDFTHGEAFGYPGSAFIALFGDLLPAPVGFEIVRVDPRTGDITEFARNHGDRAGPGVAEEAARVRASGRRTFRSDREVAVCRRLSAWPARSHSANRDGSGRSRRRRAMWTSELVIAVVLAGCGAEQRGEPEAPEVIPATREETRGRHLFQKYCYQCHPGGSQGVGPALNDKPLPAAAIRTQIRAGVGSMPSFGDDWLSDDQVAEIADYVTTLHHTPARTAFR